MATKPFRLPSITYGLGVIIIGVLLLIGSSGCSSKDNTTIETDMSNTVQSTATYTPLPTKNLTPSPTQITFPSTSTLGINSTVISNKDGEILVYVPEGEFVMGNDDGGGDGPAQTLYLDAFWIDQTEVTNRQYS